MLWFERAGGIRPNAPVWQRAAVISCARNNQYLLINSLELLWIPYRVGKFPIKLKKMPNDVSCVSRDSAYSPVGPKHLSAGKNDPTQFFISRLRGKWGREVRQRSAPRGPCSFCCLRTVIARMGCRARPACRNPAPLRADGHRTHHSVPRRRGCPARCHSAIPSGNPRRGSVPFPPETLSE
jgi:hypothetical protein